MLRQYIPTYLLYTSTYLYIYRLISSILRYLVSLLGPLYFVGYHNIELESERKRLKRYSAITLGVFVCLYIGVDTYKACFWSGIYYTGT